LLCSVVLAPEAIKTFDNDSSTVLRFNFSMTVDDRKDPPCPDCGCMMWLKQIEPDKPGQDERTFECPRCQRVESFVVELGD
jgi:formamidopyrimidine-DNA glycosylase